MATNGMERILSASGYAINYRGTCRIYGLSKIERDLVKKGGVVTITRKKVFDFGDRIHKFINCEPMEVVRAKACWVAKKRPSPTYREDGKIIHNDHQPPPQGQAAWREKWTQK